MRIASEMDFEVQPTDSFVFVIEQIADTLNKIRTVDSEKALQLKVYVDVEIK